MTDPASTEARAPWRATVLTLFPELFPGPLGASLVGEALQRGLWSLDTVPSRDFGIGRHRSVDDTPAGGGAGMVLRADVRGAAIDAAQRRQRRRRAASILSPRGEPLTQALVRELAAGPGALLLAGRFEGIDERVIEARGLREVSIGDYVLSGGELAAMVLIDAVVRLLPGVVGRRPRSPRRASRPACSNTRTTRGRANGRAAPIPDVLLSGDHKRIAEWRRAEAERLTAERRPDLAAPAAEAGRIGRPRAFEAAQHAGHPRRTTSSPAPTTSRRGRQRRPHGSEGAGTNCGPHAGQSPPQPL